MIHYCKRGTGGWGSGQFTKGVASIVPGNGTTGYHGSMGPSVAGEVGRNIIDHCHGTATEIIEYEYVP